MVRQVGGGFPHPSARCWCSINAGTSAGLPVVDMDHVRPPRQVAREMRDAFGKKNEPLGVVGVADVVFLINAGAVDKIPAGQ